jgi:uncharacterized membrane protein (UPF0127 family)
MRIVSVEDQSRQTQIGARIRVADTSLTRLIGLLSRSSLEDDEGLWIRPSSGVHTLGMRFAIDVVGLDPELRVVRLWAHLKPFRVTAVNFRITSVLELRAGRIAACDVQVGDLIQID